MPFSEGRLAIKSRPTVADVPERKGVSMAVMPIEWGAVREFAMATGNNRSEYLHENATIPPTFLATVIRWDDRLGVSGDKEVLAVCRSVGVEPDWEGLLSLEQEYRFHGPPPRVGDRLVTSQRFDGVEVKQGRRGPMVLVRFTVLFHDDPDGRGAESIGGLRAECTYTSAFLPETARPGGG